MAGINKVILVGALGKDPEIKQFQNGDKVAMVSLATSEKWQDKNTGEWQEKTEWHNVVVFGKSALYLAQYAQKGSKLYIEGKLQTRKYQDKQGQDRYVTEVVCNGFSSVVEVLTNFVSNQQQSQYQQNKVNNSQRQYQRNYHQASRGSFDNYQDDMPF